MADDRPLPQVDRVERVTEGIHLHYALPVPRDYPSALTIVVWLGPVPLTIGSVLIVGGAVRDGDIFNGTPLQTFFYLWVNTAVLLLWAAWAGCATRAALHRRPRLLPENLLLFLGILWGAWCCTAQYATGVQFVEETTTYIGKSWPVFGKLFRSW